MVNWRQGFKEIGLKCYRQEKEQGPRKMGGSAINHEEEYRYL